MVERVGSGTAKISAPVGNLSHIKLTPNFHTCGTMGSESRNSVTHAVLHTCWEACSEFPAWRKSIMAKDQRNSVPGIFSHHWALVDLTRPSFSTCQWSNRIPVHNNNTTPILQSKTKLCKTDNSPKNEHYFIIYSSSCQSKPAWLNFLYGT